jgi:hypothetical protein
MKKVLLISLFVGLFSQTKSQSFFKDLINTAKVKLSSMSKDAASNLTNKLLDDAETELKKVTVYSVRSLSEPKKIENNLVDINAIDSGIKKQYPKFYEAYISIQKNDPTIKKIVFGFKENPKSICIASPKKGIIFFDLYFFENQKIKEDRAIFDLYQMTGYLHFKPKPSAENNQIDNNVFTYEYALTQTKNFAISGNCGPLKYAVSVINRRQNQGNSQDNVKNKASEIVSKGTVFQECKSYIETNCK